MRNVNAFIGALAIGSIFALGTGFPYQKLIFTIGIGLLFPIFLAIQFVLDIKDKQGSWFVNLISSLGFLILAYGILFKMMYWPGSGFLLLISLFLVLPLSMVVSALKGFGASKTKFARIFSALGGIAVCNLFLFKMMHWPGSGLIGFACIPLVTIGLFSIVIIWRNSDFQGYFKSPGFVVKAMLIPVLFITFFYVTRVSKAILDNFVEIEDNTQKSAIMQLDRGNVYVADMKAGYIESKNENKVKAAKINYYNAKIAKIDEKTAELIEFIDRIKMLILERSGEVINTNGSKTVFGSGINAKINWSEVHDKEKYKSQYGHIDSDILIWKRYDKKDPLRPSRLNLIALRSKDNYDVPMYEIIGEEINNPDPSKAGMKVWKMLNDYRSFVVEEVGTFHTSIDSTTEKGVGDPNFTIKTQPINSFRDNMDLDNKVDAMLKASNVSPEDLNILKQIYMELTKQERFAEHYDIKNVHWIGKTFDHSPLVGALASLTAIQAEVLNARATAVGHLRAKIALK
jgi:hypothetical protein